MPNTIEDKPKRKTKGIWIPIEIWEHEDLSLQEKVFLAEIDSLDNDDGCWASNEYFAKHFDLSKNRISVVISSLVNKGFLTNHLIYKENSKEIYRRILRITSSLYPSKHCPPISENANTPSLWKRNEGILGSKDTPPFENAKDNNLSFNNPKEYLLKDIGAPSELPSSSSNTSKNNLIAKANRIIKHLNKVTSKNLKLLPANRQPIIARLKVYTYKDCIEVINKKSKHEWFVENGNMTIDTLFRPKNFDKYLNEDPKQFKKQNKGPSNGSGVSGTMNYQKGKTIKVEWVDLGEDNE